jgi:hypothetical protein
VRTAGGNSQLTDERVGKRMAVAHGDDRSKHLSFALHNENVDLQHGFDGERDFRCRKFVGAFENPCCFGNDDGAYESRRLAENDRSMSSAACADCTSSSCVK